MDNDTQMTEEAETPVSGIFVPPSINESALLSGDSYTHFSPVPPLLSSPAGDATAGDGDSGSRTPCVLGVDEAGRGPVLGPMVYGVFYVPADQSDQLLRSAEHRFDDSKALTPAFRSALMRELCTADSTLHRSCGWAISALSARDIAAGMLSHGAPYNLNAQAFDATVALIRGVYAAGVNIAEIYVDTVGSPAAYQKRLERVFPAARITVAKKADSLYPCVSAASVAAKVTRDAALETLYRARSVSTDSEEPMAWGSGYPSDGRCVSWMRANMHPVFGWGPECRFSWGTAKDMLEEGKGSRPVKVEWPVDDDGENGRVTDFLVASGKASEDELGTWYGSPVGVEAF